MKTRMNLLASMVAVFAAFSSQLGMAQDKPLVGATENWRVAAESFSRDNFKHPAWGYGHSKRVYALAKTLARADKADVDDDVLFAAAMMHDIAAFPNWASADKDHADKAVEILPEMLRANGFPEEKIPAVIEAVRTHMFDRKPASPEAIYIHDADTLDWLGAIGAYRLIAIVETGGNQPDAKMALGLLEQRLAQAPAGVVSRAGMRELQKRERSLKRILAELRAQSRYFEDL
jgi:uncharacterized protein